jgi:anti-sigma B factor antagonist
MSIYHQLGVSKKGDVLVVRFGEHRILDEAVVNRIGNELYDVADRADCHHLLLNFASVAGLSTLMVGKLLMLQRKMESKGGKLKLCDLGPELQEIVTSTKLDQILDTWDSEQDALGAFAYHATPT